MKAPLLCAYKKAINVIYGMTKESQQTVSRYINAFENLYIGPYGDGQLHMENYIYYLRLRRMYDEKLVSILYNKSKKSKKA